ncbi:MAG: DUF637 domain-containing protein [Paracoccaceae bacterium]
MHNSPIHKPRQFIKTLTIFLLSVLIATQPVQASIPKANMVEGAIDAAISSAMSSAVYGTDFESGFLKSFGASVANLAMADFQTLIGDQKLVEGSIEHMALHGAVGCAFAEISGGDCAAGAMAAVGTSLMSGYLDDGFKADPSKSAAQNEAARQQYEQNTGAMVGAIAAFFASSGRAENVSLGGSIARSAVANNRQLHRIEAQYLAELTKDMSDEERLRYQAAACFLVKCAAGVPEYDAQYATLKRLQDAGAGYLAEQTALQSVSLDIDKSYHSLLWGDVEKTETVKLFEYTWGDDWDDYAGRHREGIDRTIGGIEGILGAGEAVGSVAGGGAICAAGVASVAGIAAGCGGGAYIAAVGFEDGYARSARGIDTPTGPYNSTAGTDVLSSFDPSWTGGGRYTGSVATRFAGDIIGVTLGAVGGIAYRRITSNGNPFKRVEVVEPGRPTPRQSELDVGDGLGDDFTPQKSFIDGDEVPYGTRGSVRPDFCDANCSIEVKNYDVNTNGSGLVNNVIGQVEQRAVHLPDGMTQRVVIDIRGQVVSDATRDRITNRLVERSNGLLTDGQIRFVD